MSRITPYRRIISDLVNWRQEQALNATIFILKSFGPTGFLLHEENSSKNYKVYLGDPHNCTCTDFRKDKDLCIHICWILLKKFRLNRDDPNSWQRGLIEREINELLFKPHKISQPNIQKNVHQKDSVAEGVTQRPISKEDVCPICQEELLASRFAVTYCRMSCGNSVHIRCMKIWAEHQRRGNSTSEKITELSAFIKCPMCRESFSPYSLLLQEIEGSKQSHSKMHANSHPEKCCHCNVQPIVGKCYRCQQCPEFYLCQRCFNLPAHPQHQFLFREKRASRWQETPVAASLPAPLVNSLQNRDLHAEDYDLLQHLLEDTQGSELSQRDVESLPKHQVREKSRLLEPGRQCSLCLMSYRVGDSLRRLPKCGHMFHTECIDPLLLHRMATCPLDGQQVVPIRPHKTTCESKAAMNENGISSDLSINALLLNGQGCGIRFHSPSITFQNSRLPPLPRRKARQPFHTLRGDSANPSVPSIPYQQSLCGIHLQVSNEGSLKESCPTPTVDRCRCAQRVVPKPLGHSFGAIPHQVRARSLSADRQRQLNSFCLDSRGINSINSAK